MGTEILRVAFVAPLHETVPPRKYGGTERVLSFLIEELVSLGHSVTLYGARGSGTSGRFVECWPGTFRETGIGYGEDDIRDADTAQLQRVFSTAPTYDVVHIHHGTYPFHATVFQNMDSGAFVWTEHGNVHVEDKPTILRALTVAGIGMIAISQSQRESLPDIKWSGTVHNGIPTGLLCPNRTAVGPEYLAFLGRIDPNKGITAAIRIAAAAGLKLKVAANVDDIFETYYDSIVKPLIQQFDVEFIGEIADSQKSEFLSNAIALIFPVQWPEPFGMVMIEAMACGTPLITFDERAVREIIEHGRAGFIVNTEEEAVKALRRIGDLDRTQIRTTFEQR